jgi:hypothetical protein
MIDLGRSFTHPFEDRDWAVKMLIGAGVQLVPILNFALYGYGLEVTRNTARSQDVPLPKWDDLGKHFVDGLKLFVVQLIYAIPIIAVTVGMTVLGIVFGIGMDNAGRATRDTMTAGFAVVMVSLFCLIFIYGLFYAFITPAYTIQIARTGEIGSAFRFHEMFALIKRRPTDYLIVFILPVALGIVLAIAFSVVAAIPFIGLCLYFPMLIVTILAVPYATIVTSHWYGQLMRD